MMDQQDHTGIQDPVVKVVKHRSLLRDVVLDGQEIPTSEAVELLHEASRSLKRLGIRNRDDIVELLRKVSGRNFSLDTLVISKCRSSPQNQQILQGLLRRVIRLSSGLRMLKLKIRLGAGHHLFKDIHLMHNLKCVDLGKSCQDFSAGDLQTITATCRNLEEFTVFSDDPDIGDLEIGKFCDKMAASLHVLRINAKVLSDRAVASIVKCRNLRILSLVQACNLTRRSLLHISTLQRLIYLKLTAANEITHVSWMTFFQNPNAWDLQLLDLSYCWSEVNDKVLRTIAIHCRALLKLGLCHCSEATAEGLKEIFVACKRLKKVNVVGVTDASNSFPAIVSHCPSLEVLTYDWYGLPNDAEVNLNLLKRSCPTLKLIEISPEDFSLPVSDMYRSC